MAWLTFVQGLMLDELCGGRRAVEARLRAGDGVALHDLGPGLMIQAGPAPRAGDTARGERLDAMRHVAQVLAPARLPAHAGIGSRDRHLRLAQAWLEALERAP